MNIQQTGAMTTQNASPLELAETLQNLVGGMTAMVDVLKTLTVSANVTSIASARLNALIGSESNEGNALSVET